MIDEWLNSMRATGFDVDLESSGNPLGDVQSVRSDTIIAPLVHLGLIQAQGEDAQPFLHNLLTNDVNGLGLNDLLRAGFCTPKGRMLADFLIWRDGDGVKLQLSADMLPAILKKLSMYVLRSKVKLGDASQTHARIGLSGSQAIALLQQLNLPTPAIMQQQPFAGGVVLGLGGQRFEIVLAADRVAAIWQALATLAKPVGVAAWRALDVAAGIPLITSATQESFVPQMVNFELIGGVSFKKGCYPGQEIVARTHYLGKVKRRMYRAHVATDAVPVGASIYAPETGDQACGAVVETAPSVDGGIELLFSAQSSCVAAGEIHVGSAAGPLAHVLSLPYPVE